MDSAAGRSTRKDVKSGVLQSNITAEVYQGRKSRSLPNASNANSAAALPPSQTNSQQTASAAKEGASASASASVPAKNSAARKLQDQNVQAKVPTSSMQSTAVKAVKSAKSLYHPGSAISGPGQSVATATTAAAAQVAEAVAAAAAMKKVERTSRSQQPSQQQSTKRLGLRRPEERVEKLEKPRVLASSPGPRSHLGGSRFDETHSHVTSSSHLHRDPSTDRRRGSSTTISSKPTLLDHRKPRRCLEEPSSTGGPFTAHKSPVFSVLKECGLPMYIIPLQKGGINDVEKLIALTAKDLADFGLPEAHVAVLMAKFNGLKEAAAKAAAAAAAAAEQSAATKRERTQEPGARHRDNNELPDAGKPGNKNSRSTESYSEKTRPTNVETDEGLANGSVLVPNNDFLDDEIPATCDILDGSHHCKHDNNSESSNVKTSNSSNNNSNSNNNNNNNSKNHNNNNNTNNNNNSNLHTTLAGLDLEIAERALAASGQSDLLQRLLLRGSGKQADDSGHGGVPKAPLTARGLQTVTPTADLPAKHGTPASDLVPTFDPTFGYMVAPCFVEDGDSPPHLMGGSMDSKPMTAVPNSVEDLQASLNNKALLSSQSLASSRISPRPVPPIVPPSALSSSEQMPDISLPFGLDDNGADADIEPEPADPKRLKGRRREINKPGPRGVSGKALMPEPLGLEETLQSVDLHMHFEKLAARGVRSVDALKNMSEAEMAEVGLPRGHALKLKKKASSIQEAAAHIAASDKQSGGSNATGSRHSHHHNHGMHGGSSGSGGGGKGHGRWSSTGSRSRTFSLPEPLQDAAAAAASSSDKTPVERSWGQVQELGVAEAADKLYKNLFELAPEAVTMFPPAVLQKHRDWSPGEVVDEDLWDSPTLRKLFGKVVSAIGCTVAGLHDVDAIVPVLLRLGARHASYGVAEAYWPILGRAFDMTLEELLGEAYTDDVRDAWMLVYNFMSSMMIEGASRCQQVAKGGFDISCPDDVSQDSQTTATGSHLQIGIGDEEHYSPKRKQQASTSSTLPDVEDRCK